MINIYWNLTEDNISLKASEINIIAYIEKNKKDLRKKYKEIIKKIRNIKVENQSIYNLTKIDIHHNLYDCSTIEEKSFYKSKGILSSLKILALTKILKNFKIKKIKIINVPKKEKKIINELIAKKKIELEYEDNFKESSKIKNLKDIYDFMPNFIKANYQILKKLYLKIFFKKNLFINEQFENLFYSNTYYLKYKYKKNTKLQNKLLGSICNVSKSPQLLICHYDKNFSSEVQANKYFYKQKNNFSFATINSLITLKIIFIVLIKYYKIYFFSKKLDLIKSKIKNDKYLRYFFPLLEDDWNKSFKGITAVENLIFIYISKFFFSKNSIKKNFYYICENQGWEKIFVKSFKIFNPKSKAIGVINASIRYWDFRYSFTTSKNNISPDIVFVNKINSFDRKFFKKNFCKKIVFKNNIFDKYQIKKLKKKKKKQKILIYGDIIKENNILLFKILNKNKFAVKIKFDFKPHPSTLININDFKNLNIKEIASVNSTYDKILTVGGTGGIYDAVNYTKNVGVFVPIGKINFAPNLNNKGIKIINNFNNLDNFLIKK